MAKKRTKKLAKNEGPSCHCLILCDDIRQSHAQGKLTIKGVIGQIRAKEIPGLFGNICLFARIANVLAEETVTITFEEATSGDVLWRFKVILPKTSGPLGGPNFVHTIATRIPPFPVKHEGVHLLTLSHRDVPLTTAAVLVLAVRAAHDGNNEVQDGD